MRRAAWSASYLRSQPTRILFPTEIFRLQSSSIKNVAMNGDIRYTNANMNMPNYYENFQGLDMAFRAPMAGALDYLYGQRERQAGGHRGRLWHCLGGHAEIQPCRPGGLLQRAPARNADTINGGHAAHALHPGKRNHQLLGTLPRRRSEKPLRAAPVGTPLPDYFGQNFLTNNLTGSWDASSRATLSLTYRHGTHTIAQGSPAQHATGRGRHQQRNRNHQRRRRNLERARAPHRQLGVERHRSKHSMPTTHSPRWAPRKPRHYRVHTMYRPKPWATISGA